MTCSSCSFVHASIRVCFPKHCAQYLTHFHQTYVNDELWDRDERVIIWSQKVKRQGHGGIKYAGNNTFWACYHDVLNNVSRTFTITAMMYYGTDMNAFNLWVKGQSLRWRWNNICWKHHCTGGDMQYSTSHVELDFLVFKNYNICVTNKPIHWEKFIAPMTLNA